MGPEQILSTYDSIAAEFARLRNKTLFERPWLDRFLSVVPPPRRVLDLGCGTGRPIAGYLTDRRAQVTGVDGAPQMLALFRANVPKAEAVEADMRGLDLGQGFDGILAWNSFFHLSAEDQRAMFPVFAAHAAPGAALMFTSGPCAGEVVGEAAGKPVFHASLAPEEYRSLLEQSGFEVLQFVPEDEGCHGHTVWLARHLGGTNGPV